MSNDTGWFPKLLPPKVKPEAPGSIRVGETQIKLAKFRPHLFYNKELGCLSILLCDCSMREDLIEKPFDVLRNNHPRKKKGTFAGFNLWGVRGILHHQGYKKTSISLVNLIRRFDRYHKMPYGVSVFGKYKDHIIDIAREHQFVWHIPN